MSTQTREKEKKEKKNQLKEVISVKGSYLERRKMSEAIAMLIDSGLTIQQIV